MLERPAATVVITTKNRKEELRQAVASAVAQSPLVEVLIIDDGSTDGTAEMIEAEFPTVRLHRSEQSLGYPVQRNRGAELASAPIIFSIDDDAIFTSPDTVSQTLKEFDHPQVGAVAIPFINVNSSPAVHQKAPDAEQIYITDSYIGTAHAVRRDLFLQLGGYRERLFHQGEEGDYCIRLLDAGHVVRLGCAAPIHHFESSKRDQARMDFYGKRNLVLFAWYNVPLSYLPVHLAVTVLKGAWHGIKIRRPLKSWSGLLSGLFACLVERKTRRPICGKVYRTSRYLKKKGCVPLTGV